MIGIGITELFILLIMAAIFIWPFWRIFTKAGYSGALSILMIFPLANIAMIFFLAFSKWPIEKTIREQEKSL